MYKLLYTTTYGSQVNRNVMRLSLSTLTFLSHEGQGPGEDIHEVGQPVGVLHGIELTDVHHVVLIL